MFLSITLLLLIQAPSADSLQPDFLAALDERFVHDLHDKKIDEVLALYTANAVFVNPDGSEHSGPGLRTL